MPKVKLYAFRLPKDVLKSLGYTADPDDSKTRSAPLEFDVDLSAEKIAELKANHKGCVSVVYPATTAPVATVVGMPRDGKAPQAVKTSLDQAAAMGLPRPGGAPTKA